MPIKYQEMCQIYHINVSNVSNSCLKCIKQFKMSIIIKDLSNISYTCIKYIFQCNKCEYIIKKCVKYIILLSHMYQIHVY